MEAGGSEGTTDISREYLAEDSGGILIGISIAFIALTSVILALRFYAKRFQAPGFELDDGFIVAAYVINLGMCAVGITSVYVGDVGRHVEFVQLENPEALVGWAKCILAFEMVYFTSVALPKMAVVSLYLRVFNWRGAKRQVAYVLLGLLAATSLSLVLAACFQCSPLPIWWDKTIRGGRCFDVQMFFHAQSIPGILLDLIIMALPLETIWHLKLPTIKRIALALIFLVASFGIVASIIRARVFFSTAAFMDRTMASVELVRWSIIETGTYIITACLPHMRPLVTHYTPPWLKQLMRSAFSKATSAVSQGSKPLTPRSALKSQSHAAAVTKKSRPQPEEDEIELTTTSMNNAPPRGVFTVARFSRFKGPAVGDGKSWLGDQWPSGSPTVEVRPSVDVVRTSVRAVGGRRGESQRSGSPASDR